MVLAIHSFIHSFNVGEPSLHLILAWESRKTSSERICRMLNKCLCICLLSNQLVLLVSPRKKCVCICVCVCVQYLCLCQLLRLMIIFWFLNKKISLNWPSLVGQARWTTVHSCSFVFQNFHLLCSMLMIAQFRVMKTTYWRWQTNKLLLQIIIEQTDRQTLAHKKTSKFLFALQ